LLLFGNTKIQKSPKKTKYIQKKTTKNGEKKGRKYDKFLELECDGFNIMVTYDLYIDGSISYSRGDYWTPDYTEVNVDTIDVTIKSIEIDEYEVELTKEMAKLFENIVKQLI